MSVIITMAGHGSRFTNSGYLVPKYRIFARGYSLFYWSMLSLSNFFDEHFIFVCLSSHDIDWIKQQAIAIGINDFSFHLLDNVSKGQAETAYSALHLAKEQQPLWIYNIDTYVLGGYMKPNDIANFSGCVYVFCTNSPLRSYVQYDEDGRVINIAEKQIISDWAAVGLYGFSNVSEYKQAYIMAYIQNKVKLTNNEQYVAPLYNMLILQNKPVVTPKLPDSNMYSSLGTPEQLLDFDSLVRPPYGNIKKW